MQALRLIELFYAQDQHQTNMRALILTRCVLEPLGHLMHFLHELNEKWD
jgi:hypothetical protein